ncbi:MAG TPA: phosphatidylserine decarboxylase [Geobacteraceae bacterium]|nr:phosphatidylserine decarboxylase [Geobacteraceae bacterium]
MQRQHQYIERDSGRVCTERLFGDQLIRLIYNEVRENAPLLFRLFTSGRISSALGFINFDAPFAGGFGGHRRFLDECGVDLGECLQPAEYFDTPRKVFERQIRYVEKRPMTADRGTIVSPADSRVLVGSFREHSLLFLKEKFFEYAEFLGHDKSVWLDAFAGGDFAIFRLTPDKYHYNHVPVDGEVIDIYEIEGVYHSCNPGAVVEVVTPYSKNKRVVTVIDTDVPGGTGVGLVAMVEVVAMMIGEIVQCYSTDGYADPVPVRPGMFLAKGAPKSLYRPGSSTDVLIFQPGRIEFAEDLVRNMSAHTAESRFSQGFGRPLVETEVRVRSLIARKSG